MGYAIISAICNLFILTNLTYAAAATYKKTLASKSAVPGVNLLFLTLFSGFVCLGRAVYCLIRLFARISAGDKDNNKSQVLVGIVDFFAVLFTSLIAYLFYDALISVYLVESFSLSDGLSQLWDYCMNAIISISYYGFVFGLFGGNNCRIEETLISKFFIELGEKGSKLADIEENKGIQDYLKIFLGKVLEIIGECFGRITSIYVGVKNVSACIMFLFLYFAFCSLFWFAGGKIQLTADQTEISLVMYVIGNPIEQLMTVATTMGITFVITAFVKLLFILINLLIPVVKREPMQAALKRYVETKNAKLDEMAVKNRLADYLVLKLKS